MASKKQVTVAKSTAVTGWAERVKALAEKQVKAIAALGSQSNWISLKGGVVTVDGKSSPNGTLTGVVLGFMHERAWYEAEYDGNNPQSPDCYAYGEVNGAKASAPHEKAKNQQADACALCEFSKFGSAERGKGQACREGIRLALLLVKNGELQDQIYFLRVPPTSMKNFSGWADSVDGPTFVETVEITVTPNAKTMFDVHFESVSPLTPTGQAAVLAKLDESERVLAEPYPDLEEQAPAKPAKKGVQRRGKF